MRREDKDTLLVLGGFALLGYLLSKKKKGKCPTCSYPVNEDNHVCPNCHTRLNWGNFK
jgi:rubrerythrin